MRHGIAVLALSSLLTGCSYAWMRADSTAAQVRADEQICHTQASLLVHDVWLDAAPFGWGPMYRAWGPPWSDVPGWYDRWPDPSAQMFSQQRVYDRCMRTKGYNLVRVDRRTGEPKSGAPR